MKLRYYELVNLVCFVLDDRVDLIFQVPVNPGIGMIIWPKNGIHLKVINRS